MAVRVASASEMVDCERAVITSGTSAFELMRRAGEGAAGLIAARHAPLDGGAAVYAGTGNNGGDAWVVAEALWRLGVHCTVAATGEPRSDEAKQARVNARSAGVDEARVSDFSEAVVIDGLLGTGSTGVPGGRVAAAIAEIEARRKRGASVIALDLPSGLDATTGAHEGALSADRTITFGAIKRGHLLARELCGRIAALDIGLDSPQMRRLPLLVDEGWVSSRVPRIQQSAHKGTRKSLSIVGGSRGMAGAVILAGEGAYRSGIGLLRIVVESGNEVAIHAGIPAAIVQQWPATAGELSAVLEKVDALAIGPGLGRSAGKRDFAERMLLAWSGPVVLDADALNVFESDALSLSQLLKGRPAVVTPHPAEFARLAGVSTGDVTRDRFDIGVGLAAQLGAAVLLKGSPTVIFAPSGERFISAAGTAALATGGSGDVLTGIAGTLVAQMCTGTGATPVAEAVACAAFVHGRAAELAGPVRGTTLDDVLRAMPRAWQTSASGLPQGILAELESYA